LIDTHAHIDTEAFDEDRDEIIRRAVEAGIESIIIPAIEPQHFNNILNICGQYDNIYCAMGIHPHNADEVDEKTLQLIEENSKNKKVVAIGEIGLDYYYDFTPKDVQHRAFTTQLQLAKNHNLPVIVHNRNSDVDLMQIIKNEQDGRLRGVLHCFSGDLKMLKEAFELNFIVSFTGNITFKKSKLDEIIENTPLDKMMLETDSPYLTPVPYRGKRNEPAYVKYVTEKIAEIKKISINEVIKMTTKNAKKLFDSMLILFLALSISFAATSFVFAQDNGDFEDEEEIEYVTPYPKGLGIGFDIGTNTIVETQYYQGLDKSISYEGIFFWGGTLSWSVFDFMMLEATYNYSKNTKIIEKSNNQLGPNIHQVLELTSQWIANPHSRVNFYGMLGLSFFYNTLNDERPELETKDTPVGFNFGLGFKINIPIASVMLITPYLEWRLNWAPAKVKGITYWDPGSVIPVEVESTKFFSMPRFGIIIYPTSLNFLNFSN
jgi:TatD DNase family protein